MICCGKNAVDCTDEEIREGLTFHREQIENDQVGTPNVYVHLGDLEREAIRRGIRIG